MNELIDKAKSCLSQQITDINEPLASMIGEYLIDICTNEIIAEKIINENKTLDKLNKTLWNEAKKRKKGNGAFIPDSEIFIEVEKYFCITEADKNNKVQPKKQDKKIVNIMDFI